MKFNKGSKILDYKEVKKFFDSRKDAHGQFNTMLQKDEVISSKRDAIERSLINKSLNITNLSKVLDLGCGNGRLSDIFQNVDKYRGLDFSSELIEQAQGRGWGSNLEFFVGSVTELDNVEAICADRYNIIIISGLLIYLNDLDISSLFEKIYQLCEQRSVIYIREPISILDKQMILKNHYSEELEAYYNAIYRTEYEMAEYLEYFIKRGFILTKHDDVYFEPNLNNRKETIQRYYLLEK
jgi:ubiquinone/menaquinone biosynthesis C-methylase UbiE